MSQVYVLRKITLTPIDSLFSQIFWEYLDSIEFVNGFNDVRYLL